MIVMNAVTTGITAKSPHMLRTSMTMQQMTEPFGTWTAKNKIGKVYSLVTDYSTGIDAEARFAKGFTAGGGKIVGSSRVPLANPDYSPFVQRIKDEKPDAVFFFAPGVEDGLGIEPSNLRTTFYFTNEFFSNKIDLVQIYLCLLILVKMVNDMNLKLLIPALLLAALSGCASTANVANNDPVRARALAELEQARADGSFPLTEAQYVYPNWTASRKAP